MAAYAIDRRTFESLQLYNSHAKGIMAALYNCKLCFDVEGNPFSDSVIGDGTPKTGSLVADRPKLLSEKAYESLCKALLKKFPEVPEMSKVQGYQALLSESKSFQAELAPFYSLFKDVTEFTDAALTILLSFEKISGLNYAHHHVVMNAFFELLTNFVTIQLLMNDLGNEKKSVLATYGVIYSHLNGAAEPYFNKIVKYFGDYEKVYATIPEVLAPLGIFVVSALQSYFGEAVMGSFIPVEMLRKDNAFNVFANLKANAFEDKKLRLLPLFNQFVQHVVIGCFCCPNEALKQAGVLDVLKFALSNSISIPIFRSEFFNPNTEFDSLAKANSKLSKIKSFVSDNYAALAAKVFSVHQDKREYLNYHLKQILNIGLERPTFLAGKLPIIESLMALAKEEIKWYFAHLDRTIGSKYPKLAPKSPQVNQSFDQSIFDLIQTVLDLKQCLIVSKQTISAYYAQQCADVYSKQVEDLVADIMRKNAPSDSVSENMKNIVNLLKTCTAESNLEGVRLNFARLLVHFHGIDSTIAISTIPDFVNVMNEVYHRSRYVDALNDLADQLAEFDYLYFYRPILIESMDEICKRNSKQILKLEVFQRLATEFLKTISVYYPRETDRIGIRSLEFIDEFLILLSGYTANYFHALAMAKVNFDDQVLPESSSNLQFFTLAVINAVRVIGKTDTWTVFNGSFAPHEYLKEALAAKLKAFMMSTPLVEESPSSPKDQGDECPFLIKKPSVFLSELSSYISTAAFLDNITPFDIQQYLVDLVLEQCDMNIVRKAITDWDAQIQSTKLKTRFRKISVPQNSPFMVTYIMWYAEVVRDKATAGVQTLSLMKKAVISSSNSNFQAQLFLNFREFCALSELIGPAGVRLLDERLISMIVSLIKDLKDTVAANQELLSQLEKFWSVDGKIDESLKKIKQLDDFTQKSVTLGFLLAYRQLILESLEFSMQRKSSPLMRVIKNAHERYPANIFGISAFLGIDQLANFVGIQKNIDVFLRSNLQIFCRNPSGDAKIFHLFPLLFAIITRNVASDAERNIYNIKNDTFDSNAHLIPIAMNCLITNLVAIVSSGNMEAVESAQKIYCQITTFLLLRTKGLDNGAILLQKFLETNQILPRNVLEDYLPYAITRQVKSDMFRKAGSTIKESEVEQGQQQQKEQADKEQVAAQ